MLNESSHTWRQLNKPVSMLSCDVQLSVGDRSPLNCKGSPRQYGKIFGLWASCVWTSIFSSAVIAADLSITGFGTIGYTQSDASFVYQRYISASGTLRRDSLAGIQFDAKLTDSLGATVQILAAPSSNNDKNYAGNFAWAFLSWRPTNDFTVSVGRQRIPLYLHSQNYDVGVTYEFARLPTEMYSISPGNEFNGISFSKSWAGPSGDLNLDGYLGSTDLNARSWYRDGIPLLQEAGASFRRLSVSGAGLILSYRLNDSNFRVGLHGASGEQKNKNRLISDFPSVTLFPGTGYFQVDDALPGPGVPTVKNIRNTIATVGADVYIGNGFRMVGEYAKTFVSRSDIKIANGSKRGYVSVLKTFDKWTPYITYAFLQSDSDQLDLYRRINGNSIPTFIPGAALINASQRAGADALLVYDQHSFAIGTSYSLSPTSKIKAELMRVRIGQVSSLVDAPPGTNIRNQNINVISLSYSMVF